MIGATTMNGDRRRSPMQLNIASILGLTVVMALLFGLLKWMGHNYWVYTYFILHFLIIFVVLKCFPRRPRVAVVVAGAILLSLWVVFLSLLEFGLTRRGLNLMFEVLLWAPWYGAFAGYVAGALLATMLFVTHPPTRDGGRAMLPLGGM